MAVSPGSMGSMDPQDTQPQELSERTAENGQLQPLNGLLTAAMHFRPQKGGKMSRLVRWS